MLRPGDVLRSRYRIESFLGRGGMSDVYLAFDVRRQVHVAVKVLREDLAEDPEFVRRFRREAEALARLDHPYIVRFYSFERQGHVAFIVMDYVPGVTLRRRLLEAEGPLPLEEATRILQQVGAALQYAHNEGFIHRDIKSGNIMLREDGVALLADFGIARVAESATVTLGMVGTPAYMSPEQIRGEELDHRTDIYSLGVVLYEMVAGRRPFSGEGEGGTSTVERIRQGHLHEAPPDPRQYNAALPAGAAQVILRALAKKREERWPDVASMVRAWEEAMGVEAGEVVSVPRRPRLEVEGGGEGREEERSVSAERGERRQRLGWVMGSVVGVIVMGVLVVLGMGVWGRGQAREVGVTVSVGRTVDVEGTARALAARYAAETAEAEAILATRTAEARGTIEALAATRAAATARALASTVTAEARLTATREAQKQATATRRAYLTQTAIAAMHATATRVAVLAAQQTRSAELTRRAERMTATAMAIAATATAESLRATATAESIHATLVAESLHATATAEAIQATATAEASRATATAESSYATATKEASDRATATAVAIDNSLGRGLVGYWSFDSCAVRDESGHGLDGQVYGEVNCVDGISGSALRFGQESYILVPFSPLLDFNPNDSFSIALWVKDEEDTGNWRALVVKSPENGEWDYGVYINYDDRFMGGYHLNHVVYSTSYAEDVWMSVVLTYNQGIWRLYVDGNLEDEVVGGPLITQSDGHLAFGHKGGSMAQRDYFSGRIDEVRIYNRELLPEEVSLYARLYK